MSDKKINLEKVIGNLGENIFPNIIYFMNGVFQGHDGSVDGSNNELYKGLIHGEGLDELIIDKSVLESENPILELCKIILEKNGILFFKLGLIEVDGNECIVDNGEWVKIDEYSENNYDMGGFGIFLTKDDWNYGYYTLIMSHCFLLPEENYYYLNVDKDDKIAMEIINNINKMDIY